MKRHERWTSRRGGLKEIVEKRYKFGPDDDIDEMTGEDVVCYLAEKARDDDLERAGTRILNDFRKTSLGSFALELPPRRRRGDSTTSHDKKTDPRREVHFIADEDVRYQDPYRGIRK